MFEAGFLERDFLHAASYCDVKGLYFRMSIWGTPLSFSPKGDTTVTALQPAGLSSAFLAGWTHF